MNNIEAAFTLLSNPFVIFLILALAQHSITRLITKDSFPPIEKLRNWIFDRFPHDGYSTMKRPTRGRWVVTGQSYYVNTGVWLGELIHCPWCTGWWVALLIAAGFVWSPIWATIICLPWALRVIAGIIESVID